MHWRGKTRAAGKPFPQTPYPLLKFICRYYWVRCVGPARVRTSFGQKKTSFATLPVLLSIRVAPTFLAGARRNSKCEAIVLNQKQERARCRSFALTRAQQLPFPALPPRSLSRKGPSRNGPGHSSF